MTGMCFCISSSSCVLPPQGTITIPSTFLCLMSYKASYSMVPFSCVSKMETE